LKIPYPLYASLGISNAYNRTIPKPKRDTLIVIIAAVGLCFGKADAVIAGTTTTPQTIHLTFRGQSNNEMEGMEAIPTIADSLHILPIEWLLLPCCARASIANEGCRMQGKHLAT